MHQAWADFEASVRNLIIDVENAYWELYFSYRALDSAKAGRDSALATWRKIYTLYRIGGKGGELRRRRLRGSPRNGCYPSVQGLWKVPSGVHERLPVAGVEEDPAFTGVA